MPDSDEARIRKLTAIAQLSAFVRRGQRQPHDRWTAVLVGVVAGFVIGYLCGSLFG